MLGTLLPRSPQDGASISKSARGLAGPNRLTSRGFVLWEIMLALTIFCVVAVALTTALHQTVDASILLRDESQIRLEIENLLTESIAMKVKPGKTEVKVGDGRVHYQREVRAVEAKTAAGVVLPSLYKISVQADWRASGENRAAHAEVIVYQP
jgi:prepilin-type N-terminal cleavage/methylation domain-containing protein